MNTLFSLLEIGTLTAPNRIFMASMTRCRADAALNPPGMVVCADCPITGVE